MDEATDIEAHAEAIYIQKDGASVGEVIVENEQVLSVYTNSQVDGHLELQTKGSLDVMGDLTIRGNGGDILGKGTPNPEIHGQLGGLSGGSILTLANQTDGSPATGLKVHGRLKIQTPIKNSAYVVADDFVGGEVLLTYTDTRFSTGGATGHWMAENKGTLHVKVKVNGSGFWQLVNSEDATIWIDAPCDYKHKAAVEITHGELLCHASFVTTGSMSMQSVNGSKPTIVVAPGLNVQFDN